MTNDSNGPSAREGIASELSNEQRLALRAMAEANTGSIFIDGDFVWREDIRNSQEKAVAVLKALSKDREDLLTIRRALVPMAVNILPEKDDETVQQEAVERRRERQERAYEDQRIWERTG